MQFRFVFRKDDDYLLGRPTPSGTVGPHRRTPESSAIGPAGVPSPAAAAARTADNGKREQRVSGDCAVEYGGRFALQSSLLPPTCLYCCFYLLNSFFFYSKPLVLDPFDEQPIQVVITCKLVYEKSRSSCDRFRRDPVFGARPTRCEHYYSNR